MTDDILTTLRFCEDHGDDDYVQGESKRKKKKPLKIWFDYDSVTRTHEYDAFKNPAVIRAARILDGMVKHDTVRSSHLAILTSLISLFNPIFPKLSNPCIGTLTPLPDLLQIHGGDRCFCLQIFLSGQHRLRSSLRKAS